MREVVIVSAVRTAVGSFNGTLANIPAAELGAIAAAEAIKRAGIDGSQVDELLCGNVIAAGLGQNIARQVSIKAGLPEEVSSMSLNKVCGSGLRAISLAAQIIKAGDADCIVAGGTENMSMGPYVLPKARFGYRMGNATMIDAMVNDGLTDAFTGIHMGITAENIAAKWNLTREEQDQFAVRSQNRAEAAIKAGTFKDEIVPVMIPQKKGDPLPFDTDEFVRTGATYDALAKLKPAFKKDGSVTAGNASGINDGAAFMVVMSADKAKELGIKPLAKIVSYASAGLDPQIMGYGPVPSSKKALEKLGITAADLDLVEANEAFASQSLAVCKDLGLDPEKTNVNGGAIAIGHPVGASGARIAVTLIHELRRRKGKLGLATLCIGGGLGTALVIEACY